MNDAPISQAEAYKVAKWLRQQGKHVDNVLRDIWKKRPSKISRDYDVKQEDIVKAADREVFEIYKGD